MCVIMIPEGFLCQLGIYYACLIICASLILIMCTYYYLYPRMLYASYKLNNIHSEIETGSSADLRYSIDFAIMV